jgi:DNA-binding transcriptional regulator YiaG
MSAFRYTQSGLDNVVIKGFKPVKDDSGAQVYGIPNVNVLHRLIAKCIVEHAAGISPKELRFLRTEMGLTQAELGALVKKEQLTIGRWERGEVPIDQNAEFTIRTLAAAKLDIKPELSVEEMVRACVPSVTFERTITIQASDKGYRKVA